MKKSYSSSFLGSFTTVFIILLFFLPNLIQGKMPIPSDALINLYHPWRDSSYNNYQPGRFPAKNTLTTDPILQTYPWRQLVIDNLKFGIMPLWNPYSFAGQPLLANVQSSVFQILNLPFFIFSFKIAWTINIVLPSILTGLFTFLFLSNLNIGPKKLSTTSAIFGATILPFSGFFISWLEWGTVVTTAMWLPLILLSIIKIFSNKRLFWIIIFIFSVSQTLFSGHLQTTIYIFLAVFVFLIQTFKENRNLKIFLIIVASLFLGFLIAAPQILPTVEFINFSARSIDQAYFPGRPDWFIPYQNLIQIIAPDFFGNPTTLNYWGVWNYGEFVSFFGIAPLSLALFSLFYVTKVKSIHFFMIILGLSLLFGFSSPISKIPYIFNIPLISSLQPSRIIFLLIFSGACLAAIGLDLFLKEKNKFKKISPIFLIIILQSIILYLSYTRSTVLFQASTDNAPSIAVRNLIIPISFSASLFIAIFLHNFFAKKRILITIVFLISYIDLFRFGYKFTPFTNYALVFPKNNVTEYLKEQKRPFRIMTTDRRIMHPNSSTAYKIESVDGYDPLFSKDYATFVSAWQSSSGQVGSGSFNRIITPQKINFNFMNISNVKYLLSFDEIENENLNKVYQEGETKVYENKISNPRAYFVQTVIKKDNKKDELSFISSDDFNPSVVATSKDLSFDTDISTSSVHITSYKDNQINLNTNTDKDTPLIISNINYPGWKAFIDGEQQKILSANSVYQLLIIPEGIHHVTLKFEPKTFSYGLILMTTGVIGTLTLSIFLWRKKFP